MSSASTKKQIKVSQSKEGLQEVTLTQTENSLPSIEYLERSEKVYPGSIKHFLSEKAEERKHRQISESSLITAAIEQAKKDQHHQHILNYFIISMCSIILIATIGITIYFIIFNPSLLISIISIIFATVEIFLAYLFHKKTTNKNKS